MRSILFAVAFIFFSFQSFCQSSTVIRSETQFGIKAGLNISRFSAAVNSVSSTKPGFNIGVYMKAQMGKNSFFRPEIYYSGQGQKDDYRSQPNGPSVGKTTTTMNYMNVPLLFEFGRKACFQIGPQVGFLLSSREKGTISGNAVDDDLSDVMKKTDFGIVFGIGVNPSPKINFGFRANYGLTDVYKADEDHGVTDYPDIKNRVIHIYFATSF